MIYPQTYSRYILAADETALPALERWLEGLNPEARVDAFALVQNNSSERPLPSHPGLTLTWLHRAQGADIAAAVAAVIPAAEEDTFIWAAGETTSLLPLRRHLREIGFNRRGQDIRGYWKIGESEHKDRQEDMKA